MYKEILVSLHRAFQFLTLEDLDPIRSVGGLNLRIQYKSLQTLVGNPKPSTGNSMESVLILTSQLSESAVYY